ncbi:hypothetical protein ACFV08_17355, partial [Streptomyces fradiae]
PRPPPAAPPGGAAPPPPRGGGGAGPPPGAPASSPANPAAPRQGNAIATSFHPELTGDHRVHALFVDMVRSARV